MHEAEVLGDCSYNVYRVLVEKQVCWKKNDKLFLSEAAKAATTVAAAVAVSCTATSFNGTPELSTCLYSRIVYILNETTMGHEITLHFL